MKPFWGYDHAVADWVAKRVDGCERGFGSCRSLGVMDDEGNIRGGIVFHDYWPERGLIEVSAAGTHPAWFTHDVERAAIAYMFDVARLGVARTGVRNTRVRRMWKHLGATETVIPFLWSADEDAAILTLSQEAWTAKRGHVGASAKSYAA